VKIQILHLEEGFHQFEETFKAATLHFYKDDIYPYAIDAKVSLNKFEKNITCLIEIKTKARFKCDRCLGEFNENRSEKTQVLFHLGQDSLKSDDEEIIQINPDQKEIDITGFIKEMLILSVPMKAVCKESCRGICASCGADLNSESCSCSGDSRDPRWDKLSKLLK
jgi:uncharacterized metal-binding protein YceD (DUF177 family)